MSHKFKNYIKLSQRLMRSGFDKNSLFPRPSCISNYLLFTILILEEFEITPSALRRKRITTEESGWKTKEFAKLLEERHFIIRLSAERMFSKIKFKLGPKLEDIIEDEKAHINKIKTPKVQELEILTIRDALKCIKHLIEEVNPPYTSDKHKIWYESVTRKLEQLKKEKDSKVI